MMKEDKTLSIGGLSKLTGCNIETIRYYEKIALLPAPLRTQGGHRLYSNSLQKRLIFICKARGLGFTLEEVRNLLELINGDYSCDEVKHLVLEHLNVVKTKIDELARLQSSLELMASQCAGGDLPDCAAIDSLFEKE
ncbi:MerR family transcriptional regulator [Neptunomonas qingdaonensis]|uniref:MerR family transcriptional regulator, mercuric resistance operon regulatory protein n=1 Tax=Neptunomonas qingdaonensis TaxID=1045558 RepID=A0A1I2SL09_9GAMM|nr:helix-turn-helix domain-containing protein [Neptunomonas qingdaonensis]SFG52419.1 MerR family transcriptional regulator, mercuric resistance operon regulatory protein [Neptunomonas qingdaonensis]